MKPNSASHLPRSHGSALILVLLMIVLLATIAVSFLSTARIEQIATRNFTRQTAARGLADMATGEAMAKIASGFTATNTNATTVTISQPGLIRSFEFTGNGTPTVNSNELFPTTNTNGTFFNINTNGIITGDPVEILEVPWQTITNTNGETIGRITYYVDDEGTKLNLNHAAGTRTTLNASGRRPLDISAVADADTTAFSNIISGNTKDPENIASWVHFFRPEQAVGAGVVASNQVPLLATAMATNANSLSDKTAWGTERLYINELPVTDASVTNIYQALTGLDPATGSASTTNGKTGQGLTNIFQGGFAEKYTDLGLKQTSANILQMRKPETRTPEYSFSFKDALMGGEAEDLNDDNIPEEFHGRAFFPVISEFALFAMAYHPAIWGQRTRFVVAAVVEVNNPYSTDYPGGGWLEVLLDKGSYSLKNPETQTVLPNLGPQGEAAGDTWTTRNAPGESYYNHAQDENGVTLLNGTHNNFAGVKLPEIPANTSKRFTFFCVHNFNVTAAVTEEDIKQFKLNGPVDIRIKRITLYAGDASVDGSGIGDRPDSSSIRDWVTGEEMDAKGFGGQIPVEDTEDRGEHGDPPWRNRNPIADTFQRSDARIKTSKAMVEAGAPHSPWYFDGQTLGQFNNARPSNTSGDQIPGDPSPNDSVPEALWPVDPETNYSMMEPMLLADHYTCPADLGKVLTSLPWRTLRMQVQPAAESAAALIPDWAMLEVISFGPQAAGAGPLDQFQPVNLNGMFHVPRGSAPDARDIGLKSLIKVLDQDPLPNLLADPMSTNNSTVTIEDPKKFLGETQNDASTAVANNIGTMQWSDDSEWAARRAELGFPEDAYLLASEIMEIAGVADSVSATDYDNSSSHFKWNEGRASALLPAASTRSSHFMIYACAETLDRQGEVQSEALTKTLVEVYEDPNTAGTYKVKQLYAEPIRVE